MKVKDIIMKIIFPSILIVSLLLTAIFGALRGAKVITWPWALTLMPLWIFFSLLVGGAISAAVIGMYNAFKEDEDD